MARKDHFTNIMLDLECCSVEAHNPIIIELAAVHFDIDTGDILGHYRTIISFQSCKDHGLVDDGLTMSFLRSEPTLKFTLEESKESEISLEHALSKFTAFVEESQQRTLKLLDTRSSPRNYTQPMIWGNGAASDNVYA